MLADGVWGKVFWGKKWLGLFAPQILLKFPLVFMNFLPGIQRMCVICLAEKEGEEIATKVARSVLWGV